MSQLLLVNPRRKKRRSTAKRRPARRTAAKRTHRRRAARTIVVANPRRKRTHRRHVAARKMYRNPRRRRGASRSGMGLGSMNAFFKHTLMPSFVGAGGALGLDVLLAVLPLPAMLQTGVFRPVVRLGGAALLGIVASKVVNRRVGEQVAAGATVVVLYDLLKNLAQTAMPTLPLSGYPSLEYYSAGQNMGEYFAPQVANQGAGIVQPMNSNMGEYVL